VRLFVRLGTLLTVTALLGLFIGARLERRGEWLPVVPDQIGAWEAVDTPLEEMTVKTLGNPKTLGREYRNPFDERIQAHIIATASFDAYHEPAICMAGYGYSLTAETFLPLFGPQNFARAMILKNDTSEQRVLMLYWIQYEDGTTSGRGNLRTYNDLVPRLKTGLTTTTTGKQSVIVRVYIPINPLDPNGRQARRSLWEVSRGLYDGVKKDGGVWRTRETAAERAEGTQ
jgi:hypothetical protein